MVHLYKDGLHLNNYGKDEINNFIDNIDSFLQEIFLQMIDFWIGNVQKEKKRSYKNHINSAKHDSDFDDSFDISSENQQSNNKLDLEGLQK